MVLRFVSYDTVNLDNLRSIYNCVIEAADAFPGDTPLTRDAFQQLLDAQTEANVLLLDGHVVGFYILHPNQPGRLRHMANCSYAIAPTFRGQGLAKYLVQHSLDRAQANGFIGMQFNAVVAQNYAAIHTYEKLGFNIVGTVTKGYRLKDDTFTDMHIMLKLFD